MDRDSGRPWLMAFAGGVIALVAGPVLTSVGCFNSHVFEIVPECAITEEPIKLTLDPNKASDILIVLDNSGSMCEEQDNLGANFFNDSQTDGGTFACPLADPAQVGLERFVNPTNEVVEEELANCGFIQVLAAYENDYRVGVITTDVGVCDNRLGHADDPAYITHPNNCDGEAIPGWGRRPQRGCLQAPPGATEKFLTPQTENIGERFVEILDNVQTFGNSYERGLDAARIFLDPEALKDDACAGDAESFLRPEADLLVIYLSDEDDCSTGVIDAFPAEDDGDDCTGLQDAFATQNQARTCYEPSYPKAEVAPYAEHLKSVKGENDGAVRVAVISAATFDADGKAQPESCLPSPTGPINACNESLGSSHFNQLGQECHPDRMQAAEFDVCCQADKGEGRYYELAGMFEDDAFTDSICFDSFRETMIDLAQFIAAIDSVRLMEAPPFPNLLRVEVKKAGDTEPSQVERLPGGALPADASGWQLRGCCTVQFIGDAIPQPGDEINVFVLRSASGTTEACVGAPDAPPSGGDAGLPGPSGGGDAGSPPASGGDGGS